MFSFLSWIALKPRFVSILRALSTILSGAHGRHRPNSTPLSHTLQTLSLTWPAAPPRLQGMCHVHSHASTISRTPMLSIDRLVDSLPLFSNACCRLSYLTLVQLRPHLVPQPSPYRTCNHTSQPPTLTTTTTSPTHLRFYDVTHLHSFSFRCGQSVFSAAAPARHKLASARVARVPDLVVSLAHLPNRTLPSNVPSPRTSESFNPQVAYLAIFTLQWLPWCHAVFFSQPVQPPGYSPKRTLSPSSSINIWSHITHPSLMSSLPTPPWNSINRRNSRRVVAGVGRLPCLPENAKDVRGQEGKGAVRCKRDLRYPNYVRMC